MTARQGPAARPALIALIALMALGGSGLAVGLAGSIALAPAARADDASAWVERQLQAMTTRQKVGQLFVPRVYGTTADTAEPQDVSKNLAELGVANTVELIRRYQVGGIVYFGGNVTTPRALARFGNAVQSAAAGTAVPIGVLTAIDQEQGLVVRVGPPATVLPGSMALGAAGSAQAAELAARITGEELRAMGVFADYAPVADVNLDPRNPVIGVRSFSSSPAVVAQLVAAQVRGLQAAGVAATAKHFPGHGDTAVDSHVGLPVIDHDRATLEAVDLLPFAAAIDAGVDAIMTGHLLVPAIDRSGLPATVSGAILTGLLRERLGFTGVVVTDSLRMEGVRTRFGDGEVAVRAILAGADQLLDPPSLVKAHAAVLEAVRSGRISQDRLDDSVRRILRLKAKRGLRQAADAMVDVARVPLVVGSPEHQRQAQWIADQTTTLVADAGQVPIPRIAGSDILVTGRGESATAALAKALGERGARVRVLESGSQPDSARIAAARAAARAADVVVVLTYDAGRSQRDLVTALKASGTPVVVASTGAPYDLGALPEGLSALATYSDRRTAMAALARVLAGQASPVGRLPVSIPGPGGTTRYALGWRAPS